MHDSEIAGLVSALAPVVADFTMKAMAPLRAENKALLGRLDALEKRFSDFPTKEENSVLILRLVDDAASKIPQPQVDPAQVEAVVVEKVAEAVAAIPPAEPGKDADPETISRMVQEEVAKLPPAVPGKDADPALVAELVDKAVAALPPAKDGEPGPAGPAGANLDPKDVAELISAEMGTIIADEVRKTFESWPVPKDGEPGASVTVEDLAPLVAEEVAKAVSGIQPPAVDWSEVDKMIGDKVTDAVEAIPPAAPGKDADPAQIAAMVATEVERAVAEIPQAKDGIGLAGALIDREGCLVVTLTDGSTKTLGTVVGKDVDIEAVASMVRAEVAKIPVPKDGLGFEDMSVEYDGERGCVLRFERGDIKKEFAISFPVVLDRGVWREQGYSKGDGTTYGGSFFIAQRATEAHEKPGNSDGWRLAIKKGRDGRDGAPGKPGERGPKGEPPPFRVA